MFFYCCMLYSLCKAQLISYLAFEISSKFWKINWVKILHWWHWTNKDLFISLTWRKRCLLGHKSQEAFLKHLDGSIMSRLTSKQSTLPQKLTKRGTSLFLLCFILGFGWRLAWLLIHYKTSYSWGHGMIFFFGGISITYRFRPDGLFRAPLVSFSFHL